MMGSMALSRIRPSIWIPLLMVLWGSVSALMALVRTPAQLIAVRFVLGVTEAGFSPAVLFIISNWYRRHEQSKRFMCFLSAGILSGAFGGIIAGAIVDSLDGAHGISGWQWYAVLVLRCYRPANTLEVVHRTRCCDCRSCDTRAIPASRLAVHCSATHHS
jgi:MFS family permease